MKEKIMKKIYIILLACLLVAILFCIGYNAGRNSAIYSARVIEYDQEHYIIAFGDEAHFYKGE